MESFVDPLRDFGPELLKIEKPSRYLGGEHGSHRPIRAGDTRLRIALCFPDLYEIGMSNNALRILYTGLGTLGDTIAVERVFAPAPDFEALLGRKGIPLYTLESGIPLRECDVVGFSVGYELLATNVLTVLEAGKVPVKATERGERDPIVIAGGPSMTNPLPYSMFFDAVWIGEAEAGFYGLMADIAGMKSRGATRGERLARLRSHPSMWMPARPEGSAGGGPEKPAVRAIHTGFPTAIQSTAHPLAVLKPVQDNGTVEIMRGCPNGCRFCHAGYYYRPQRAKAPELIAAEVESLVRDCGYREITLSSLSSGDYPDIHGLIRELNGRWSGEGISFQLPSLKVDSFTLPLLETLSEVRKSGLTFAVETPVAAWQGAINKEVSFDKTADILREAKSRGFRLAKFYFMIGLPVPGRGMGEAQEIVTFLKSISRVERIALNVAVGTFIPKPHTPFQREPQLTEKESLAAIHAIKDGLRHLPFIKVSYHSPFAGILEGIIARGDGRVGDILLEAHRRGARLDAWDERFDRNLWRSVLDGSGWNPEGELLGGYEPEKQLPWHAVHLRVSDRYLEKESERASGAVLTGRCREECDDPCGSCGGQSKLVSNIIHNEVSSSAGMSSIPRPVFATIPGTPGRLVAVYAKRGKAAYFPMHSVTNAFARAFLMLALPVSYSEGFNPMPRMESTPPLTLGAESDGEVLSVELRDAFVPAALNAVLDAINARLPEGLRILDARMGTPRRSGGKTIGALHAGSDYIAEVPETNADAFGGLLAGIAQRSEAAAGGMVRFAFHADDAHGGPSNPVRMLESIFGEREGLTFCRLRRTGCTGIDGAGNRVALQELL